MSQDLPKPKFKSPDGVPDILPRDHEYHTYIKKVVRHRCRQSGFRRVTTPMYEDAALFRETYGVGSDLADSIYVFHDENGQELALKPDSSASIGRSFLQNKMWNWPQPVELFYIDPHFRKEEELGSGRYNHFWQFGFQIMGEKDAALDAQLIQMCRIIFDDLGIGKFLSLQINNLGNKESREAYEQALRDYFFGKERYLDEKHQKDLKDNPMRLLSSDNEDVAILAELAPTIDMFLDDESKKQFEELQEFLTELDIEFTVNPRLVRGGDHYSGLIFEFWEENKKGAVEIGGGGHFDNMIEDLGGEPTPSLGFAAGMERIIAMMKRNKMRAPSKDDLHVFVAQLSSEAKKKCLGLISELRDHGVKTMGAMGKGAIRHQLSIAEKFGVPYTLILGLTEVREGTIIIRDMSVGTQEIVPFEEAIPRIIDKLGNDTLDKYSPGEILY